MAGGFWPNIASPMPPPPKIPPVLVLYLLVIFFPKSYYFDRDDVALPGFSKHFKDQSAEELTHAEKLMKFQNKRGGRIAFYDIPPPEKDDWESSMEALKAALALETSVNQDLLKLRQLAEDHKDPQTCDFLDNGLLQEQIEEIKQIGDFITSLERAAHGLGEYIYDKTELTENK